MSAQRQSSVLGICTVQQLAAMIRSFEFERVSGSTERDENTRNTKSPSHHQQIPSREPRRRPWPSGTCTLHLATACVFLRSEKRILDSFVSHFLIGNKLNKRKFPVHRLQQGIYISSSVKPTITFGTRECLQLGQFAGFAVPSHLRSEEGRRD